MLIECKYMYMCIGPCSIKSNCKPNSFGFYWLPLYGKQIQWKSMGNKPVWLSTFFKISAFVFHKRKWVIWVWNIKRLSKWAILSNFHFWVNNPFYFKPRQGSKLRPFWSHMLPKCNLCDSKIYLGAFVRVQIIAVVRPLQFSAKRSRITARMCHVTGS